MEILNHLLTQTKYLTSSIYLDGTGDYILLDDQFLISICLQILQ